MNDEYLWDRTGEPDPEIKRLEEVLGTLRYQPQPLALPQGIRPQRRRGHLRLMAIAAVIILMILAVGLRIRFQRLPQPGQGQLAGGQQPATGQERPQPNAAVSPTPASLDQRNAIVNNGPPREITKPRRRAPAFRANSFAKNRNRHPIPVLPHDDLTAAEFIEAQDAKEKLMLALRLASAKLNIAQRKTQGSPLPGGIRNQHKVG